MNTVTQTQTVLAQDPSSLTVEDIQDIVAEAKTAAASAAAKFLAEWTEGTGGNEYGEPMY